VGFKADDGFVLWHGRVLGNVMLRML
jgi:hypothetical protein